MSKKEILLTIFICLAIVFLVNCFVPKKAQLTPDEKRFLKIIKDQYQKEFVSL